MSETDPIAPDSPLGRALNAGNVPDLPTDFADRILARTKDRPAPLPEPRRTGGSVRRWRSMRRLGIGLAVSGALATAAAATGLLGDLPSPRQVWNAVTGQDTEPAVAPKPRPSAIAPVRPPERAPSESARVIIDGPIDTPQELAEVFRRVDELRTDRKATRRENVDRRIDQALERRRAQGLPVPTPEEEARLRERLQRFRERSDAQTEQRIETRREELRDRVETGEELMPRDIVGEERPLARDPELRRRIEELRNLPPAERRQRLRELREQRQQRVPEQQSDPEAPVETTPPQGSR